MRILLLVAAAAFLAACSKTDNADVAKANADLKAAAAKSGDAAKILSRDAVDMGHGANIAGPRSLVNGPS